MGSFFGGGMWASFAILAVGLAMGLAGVEELFTVLLDSSDYHASKDGIIQDVDDAVAFLHIDEQHLPTDAIVKQHATVEEAREHMQSFLEVAETAMPATPQYIYGTAFPPTMYPHLAADFPTTPKSNIRTPNPNSAVHSSRLDGQANQQYYNNLVNPQTVQQQPLMHMFPFRMPAGMTHLSPWGTLAHYGYPGPVLM